MKLSNILIKENFLAFNSMLKMNNIPIVKTTWNNVIGMIQRITDTVLNNIDVTFLDSDIWSYTDNEKEIIASFLNTQYQTNSYLSQKFLKTLVKENKQILSELDNMQEIDNLADDLYDYNDCALLIANNPDIFVLSKDSSIGDMIEFYNVKLPNKRKPIASVCFSNNSEIYIASKTDKLSSSENGYDAIYTKLMEIISKYN